MSNFEAAFHSVVLLEGRYSDDPRDAGGKTMYGITEAVARANGYTGDMKDLPLETAKRIYKSQYWDTLNLDQVDALTPVVAIKLFSMSVNNGVGFAGTCLKRALNVLNEGGKDYPDVPADGPVGPRTLYALRSYLGKRGTPGVAVLHKAINVLQGARYIRIAEDIPRDEAYEYGWLAKRVA
jgi:lysozyme family protein